MNKLIRCQKGQGATEYIVILAIAVGLAMTIFWPAIQKELKPKVADIANNIKKAGNP